MSIKRKLHHLISGQIPEFVRVEYPQFVTFLEHYYKFLENQGEVHDVLLNNMDWMDIDETLDVFIPYFRNQYTYDMPSDTVLDNRRLIKYINQYYEAKGSETSTEMFFRFMFNDTATVKYPGDYLLRASDGRWSRKRFIKVDTTLFPNENIYELKEKVITLYYLEYIEGAGNFARTVTTRCLDVYETSRPNIYQLQVDINPNYQFPDDISADLTLAPSLGFYDTHVYVQYVGDETITYGTISKQLTSVLSVDEPGSRFRRDDTYFVSETGLEGLYFAGDYTEVTAGSAAYAYELLQNNAIVRVVKTENTFAEQYFLEDYTLFGDYASAPTRGKIKLLSIVDSGEKFLVRKTGVIESVTILDGGSGYAVGATAVNLVGDGSGAEFRVLVSGGKITQVTVVNGGSNYSTEINPSTGLPLTTLTASGSGTGAVFEVNISTGYTPVKTFSVDFNNGRSGSSTAAITFATGHIYHAPGEYVDNAGFLSDIIKLQDNDYYQPYSYVIETTEQLSNWKSTYLKSSHPAGFKMFSNLLLTGDLTPPEAIVTEDFNQINVEDLPFRALEETVTVSDEPSKTISKRLTDSVTATDSVNAYIEYFVSATDNVTTSETVARNVGKTATDTTTTSETVAKNISTVLSDTQANTDAIVKTIDDAVTDTQANTDSATLSTSKQVTDTQANTDSAILTINPVYTETVVTSETIAKDISDVLTDSSTLSDTTALSMNYVFTDTVTISDTAVNNFNQLNDATSDLQEDLSLADTTVFSTSVVFTDTQANTDGINTINTSLGKTESVSNNEAISFNVSLNSLTDTQTNTDATVLNISNSYTENVTTSDVADVILVIPVDLSDSQANTDTAVLSINSVYTDSISNSDAVVFNNNLGASDNTSLSDTLIINFNQLNDATSDLQEDLTLSDTAVLSSNIVFTDTQANTDGITFNFSDAVTDTLTLSDNLAINFNQNNDATSDFQDDLTLSDTAVLSISEVATDTVTNADNTALSVSKVATDTQTITDAGGSIWVDSYFVNGRYSASPYVAGDYVGTGYSL